MELGKHLRLRDVLMGLYVVAFAVYLVVGLQPAEAANYDVATELVIPSIRLESDVVTLHLEHRELKTPDTIVGRYARAENKTLLVGHSTTVFQDLDEVQVGDVVHYDELDYVVTETKVVAKNEVDMMGLLEETDEETIVIMTCAGELIGGGDATHRLLVTAVATS